MLVLVAANKGGVPRMTKEHVGIVCALKVRSLASRSCLVRTFVAHTPASAHASFPRARTRCPPQIPVAIIVTKCDIAPPQIFKATMKKVRGMLRLARKLPLVVRNEEQIEQAAAQIGNGGRIAPIFLTSNVTGEGLDAVRAFLAVLRPPATQAAGAPGAMGSEPAAATHTATRTSTSSAAGAARAPAQSATGRPGVGAHSDVAPISPLVRIDASFLVTGCGVVLSGLTMQGGVAANDTLLLGPDRAGQWRRVTVRSIQAHQQPLAFVSDRRQAAFAIKAVNRKEQVRCSDIRRGMVLVGDAPFAAPAAYWEFDVELLVLHHQTTMRVGYAPIVHIFFVRQAAQIVKITKLKKGGAKKGGAQGEDDSTTSECLRTGDSAIVRFRFLYFAEHLVPGSMLLMREGRAKAVGHIVALGSADGTAASSEASTLRRPRASRALKGRPAAEAAIVHALGEGSSVDAAGAALAALHV